MPARGTALERALWETLAARIAEVEKLTGPLQLVTSLGLPFLRGQVRTSLLRLDGFPTTYRRPDPGAVMHGHLWPALFWSMQRCGGFFRDKDEWRGNLYTLLDLLNNPANELSEAERGKAQFEPIFLNNLLSSAKGRLPAGCITFTRPAGVDHSAIDPRWVWSIHHRAIVAALE